MYKPRLWIHEIDTSRGYSKQENPHLYTIYPISPWSDFIQPELPLV